MESGKKPVWRYVNTALIGLVAAYAVATHQGFAWQQAPGLMARHLSDGFFVAGLMLTGVGVLVWISSTGFFDMLSYGFHSLLVLFSPLKRPEEHASYYEYKMEKEAKRGKPLYFLVVIGGIFIALSVLCLVLYYQLPV